MRHAGRRCDMEREAESEVRKGHSTAASEFTRESEFLKEWDGAIAVGGMDVASFGEYVW